jgi:hypothetical protein
MKQVFRILMQAMLVCALVVGFPCLMTQAGEHPAEHPEHPEKAAEHPEHPAEHPEHPTNDDPPSMEDVASFLEDYAKKSAEAGGGWMTIADDQTKGDRKMVLDKIHRERLAKTGEKTYFVCADFKADDGKIWDLDFWVSQSEHGLTVSETMIHKEAGVARYSWFEADGIWKRKPLD